MAAPGGGAPTGRGRRAGQALGSRRRPRPGLHDARPRRVFRLHVDGAIGAFVDPTALQALDDWNWERVNAEFLDGAWITAPVPGLRTVVADEGSGANVVITESGWGDGAYPTFIGYNAEGRVASFVTDFFVVPT